MKPIVAVAMAAATVRPNHGGGGFHRRDIIDRADQADLEHRHQRQKRAEGQHKGGEHRAGHAPRLLSYHRARRDADRDITARIRRDRAAGTSSGRGPATVAAVIAGFSVGVRSTGEKRNGSRYRRYCTPDMRVSTGSSASRGAVAPLRAIDGSTRATDLLDFGRQLRQVAQSFDRQAVRADLIDHAAVTVDDQDMRQAFRNGIDLQQVYQRQAHHIADYRPCLDVGQDCAVHWRWRRGRTLHDEVGMCGEICRFDDAVVFTGFLRCRFAIIQRVSAEFGVIEPAADHACFIGDILLMIALIDRVKVVSGPNCRGGSAPTAADRR